ncbi:MAG: 3D domain-containing protein [Oscillospiraceae bacterium]
MKKTIEKLKAFWAQSRGKVIYVLLALCLLGLSAGSIYSLLTIVKVQDGDKSTVFLTMFSSEERLLDMAGAEVENGDTVLFTSFTDNYKNLTITRTFDVPITVDGQTTTASLSQGNVADCLASAGVVLDDNDFSVPSLHAPIKQGDEIRVYRVEYVDNKYEETVPFGTVHRKNSLTYRFKKKSYVLKEGSKGKNLVTYRERYVDGELDVALVSKVEVLKKPVDQMVLSYANAPVSPLKGPPGVTVSNGVPSSYSYVIQNVAATGYSAKRGKGSSGLGLFYGSVAVNPNVIPYGTKMYIASPDGQFIYGFAIATDTGTALMEGIIGVDLFYETYKESSLNWKNVVNIYVF